MNTCPTDPVTLLMAVLLVLLRFAILGGIIFLIHFFLTLPMRRAERGLLFMDIVETGLKQGKRVEETIVSASSSGEHALGARFHLLAAWLEKGLSLADALAKVPRLLPAQVVAMLRAGQRIGDVGKVLPASRQLLQDAISQTRGAMNYMIVLAFALTPLNVLISLMLFIYIVPRLDETYVGLLASGGGTTPMLWELVRDNFGFLIAAQVCVFVGLLFAAVIYIAGPYAVSALRAVFGSLPDKIAWQVLWKRKRMQRTFSAMLSVLLDAGVPEAEAVQLAADCTANAMVRNCAGKVAEAIRSGVKLTEAVRVLDDTGEFRWRIANATHAHGGFLDALRGWHEALDAKAFQLEQATAHVVTSALVLGNGLLVGIIVAAVFSGLIAIINLGAQW